MITSSFLSIIVPLYNEEKVLNLFHQKLIGVLQPLDITYEIIYVNDGSSDHTEANILALQSQQSGIAYIKFSRNFGKEAAMTAGFKLCRGEAAIMIDADLQDPPTLIPAMLEAWRNGADVVNMKRSIRHGEPMWKIVTVSSTGQCNTI